MRRMPTMRIDEGLIAKPDRLIALGCSMMESGKGDKAVALVEAVLAQHPDDPLLRGAAEAILTYKVPGFHRDMLADETRNRAYRRAIEGAGVEGKTVLDIGAGSGLLAMMAARAGAARVYACEANEALAATARAIVAANGFGDRVRILARHSSTLDAGRDLDGGVDLIVSEIFGHDLIGEGALPSLSHAMAALARPSARIVPAGAAIRVALAEYGRGRHIPVGMVDGLDLGRFDRHVESAFNVAADHRRLALRSTPQDLFRFDFREGRACLEGRSEIRAKAGGGRVNGIVQWIRLELDGQVTYENAPGKVEGSHWPVIFHPLRRELAPRAGSEFAIHGWHGERRLLIWPGEA
jgi:SAM-dependent methyltransferase